MNAANSTQEPEKVLFVGEGNFSFSYNYMKESKQTNELIVSTCLLSRNPTATQIKNMDFLRSHGAVVHTNVDATKLQDHKDLKEYRFTKIIFNFPHIEGKMNIKENRKLLLNFFISAKNVLQKSGRIFITLCKGQGGTDGETSKRKWCNTWQIVDIASSVSFILTDIMNFDTKNYKEYVCSGYKGLEKTFNVKEAITHVFSAADQVDLSSFITHVEKIETFELINWFEDDSKNLNESIKNSHESPVMEIKEALKIIITEMFSSIIFHNVISMQACKSIPTTPLLNDDSKTYHFKEGKRCCNVCWENIFSLLPFENVCEKIPVLLFCVICCTKYLKFNHIPFSHFIICLNICEESVILILESLYNISGTCASFERKSDIELDIEHIRNSKLNSDVIIENIKNVYAICSVEVFDGFSFYTDITVCVSKDMYDFPKTKHMFEIGSIFQIIYKSEPYNVVALNLTVLACLRYHVTDYRILLTNNAFFSVRKFNDSCATVFRSKSLYPPSYIHDTSFWIDENFSEGILHLFVRKVVGYLIKDVTLIDTYYQKSLKRWSRCYRFVYQSYENILHKNNANAIHYNVLRKSLEKLLNLQMR